MRNLVIALSAARAVDTGGWTLIGYTGSFADTRYGEFHITPEQVASWQRNLAAGVVTGEPGMVGLDYEHAMDKPGASAGDMKASGWVKAIRLDGDRILAQIDWTSAAREAIAAGEFRYFSPTFADTYNNDQGQDVGPTLIGGALTNRPFLRSKGALCVQLNQATHELEVPGDEELKTLGWNELLHRRAKKGEHDGGRFIKMVPGFDGTFDPEGDTKLKPGDKVEFPSGAKGTFVSGGNGARGTITTDKGDAGAWENGSATHDPGGAAHQAHPEEDDAMRAIAKLDRERLLIDDGHAPSHESDSRSKLPKVDEHGRKLEFPNGFAGMTDAEVDNAVYGLESGRMDEYEAAIAELRRRGITRQVLSTETDWPALNAKFDSLITLGWTERLHPRQKGGPHAGEWVAGVHADRRMHSRDLESLKATHGETRAAWEHAIAAAGPHGQNREAATRAVDLQARMHRIDKQIKAASKASKAAARREEAERRRRDNETLDHTGMAFDLTQKLDDALFELGWSEMLHPRAKKGDKGQHGGEWIKGISPSRRAHGPNTSGHSRRSGDRQETRYEHEDRLAREAKGKPDDKQIADATARAKANPKPGSSTPPTPPTPERADLIARIGKAHRGGDSTAENRLIEELTALHEKEKGAPGGKPDHKGLQEDPLGKLHVGQAVSTPHPSRLDHGEQHGIVVGFDKISKEPWVRFHNGRLILVDRHYIHTTSSKAATERPKHAGRGSVSELLAARLSTALRDATHDQLGQPMQGAKSCPNCGASMSDDASSCPSCGHKQLASGSVQSATSDTPVVNEFLRKLAQALGLDEHASEDQVIARVAQLAQGAPDVRELAQKTGHVVLPAGQVATLTQQAQDGQDALEQVKVLSARLNLAEFESLMAQHPAAAPALRDTYKELWEQGQHEQVRKILSATPPSVRMTPTGRAISVPAGGEPGGGHMQLVQGTPLDRIGTLTVDEDRLELHQRTEALALAKNCTYEQALDTLTNTGEAV